MRHSSRQTPYTGRHRAPVLRSASVADRARALFVAAIAAILALGPAATANAAVETAPVVRVVKVLPGNSLWTIAAAQCGTGTAWGSLWSANPAIANPNLIYPGQRLTVDCTRTAAVSRSQPRTTPASSGWVHPIRAGLSATSCWGAPRDGGTRRHQGVDLLARSGTPIRAAAAGKVVRVSYDAGGAGWYIAIAHPGRTWTLYEHQRARSPLPVGATVRAGQTVGYVGSTGNAHSPHLHYEVHTGALWHPVNPAPFMRARGAPVGC